jgi:hypothetical protein
MMNAENALRWRGATLDTGNLVEFGFDRSRRGLTHSDSCAGRWHKSLKVECIRPLTPLTVDDARRLIQSYVDHYNTVRLHSAIGYVAPQAMLAGRQAEIHAERDRKLEQARRQRQVRRLTAGAKMFSMMAGVNPQM